jgi:uncharacterized membrane protein
MRKLTVIVALPILLSVSVGSLAAQTDGTIDECQNGDNVPGEAGPPGFGANVTPDFINDLIGGLRVPNFVKSFFGATTS